MKASRPGIEPGYQVSLTLQACILTPILPRISTDPDDLREWGIILGIMNRKPKTALPNSRTLRE